MSLLNRLRPKWQNSDPEVRAEAVRQLDKDDIELLTAVAQQDTDARVRKVAVKKLDAPRLLLELAETDEDEGVRAFALQRARQLLVQIACDSRDADESARALALLSENEDIVAVADRAHFEDVRATAFEALKDDAALAELVGKARDPALRSRALERIRDAQSLKTIVVDESTGELAVTALARIDSIETLEAIVDYGGLPRGLRRQAIGKLMNLAPEDHPLKIKEREERFAELCKQAEKVDAFDRTAPEEMTKLEVAWSELETRGAPSSELARRFAAARDEVRARKPPPVPKAKAKPSSAPANVEPSPAEAPEPPSEELALVEAVESLDDDESLEAELARARERWEALGARDTSLDDRFRTAVAQAESRLARLEKIESRKKDLETLLDAAESASRGDDAELAGEAFSKLAKAWRALEGITSAEAKARYAHVEERIHELQEKKRRAQEREEQQTLSEIQTHLARLAELAASDNLSIKEADKELRASQNFLKSMGPLPRSVNRKKVRRDLVVAREKLFKKTQEMRTLEDWKRWANADIQTGLIGRIEALRESNDIPKIAKELRVIHEEWKRAGAAPAEKAEELWQRYKSVRDELRARCGEFFSKQNEERRANLEKKEALCVEVEALADSENWNETADAIKAIQEKWKTIGPAPQKQSEAVWKRFRNACDHFFERRKSHFDELKEERGENLKKKEALCEQAEALQDSTDWHNTANELKRLQAEWRSIGAVPRKKSDQVWKRFRKACDHFFDRFKRRDEVELEERLKARQTLVDEATAFADELPGEQDAIAAKAEELWSRWKSMGPLPESRRELQEQFEAAVTRIVSRAPEAFVNTDLDPEASRKKREKLVKRLETLVSEFTSKADKAKKLDELEDLAQRLKDALASNTMTGGKPREKKADWRHASEEVRRLRSNWLRAAPVPGDAGRILGERFETAYRDFFASKP